MAIRKRGKPKKTERGSKPKPARTGGKSPPRRAKASTRRGRGRPRKEVSPAEIQKLASIGCTQEEIALVKGVSVDTLHRNYAEPYQKGYATMQMSLRRRQVKAALGGSNVMMIWLGKQYLDQRDKHEIDWRREAAEKGLSPSQIFEDMVATAMKTIQTRANASTTPAA